MHYASTIYQNSLERIQKKFVVAQEAPFITNEFVFSDIENIKSRPMEGSKKVNNVGFKLQNFKCQ